MDTANHSKDQVILTIKPTWQRGCLLASRVLFVKHSNLRVCAAYWLCAIFSYRRDRQGGCLQQEFISVTEYQGSLVCSVTHQNNSVSLIGE